MPESITAFIDDGFGGVTGVPGWRFINWKTDQSKPKDTFVIFVPWSSSPVTMTDLTEIPWEDGAVADNYVVGGW